MNMMQNTQSFDIIIGSVKHYRRYKSMGLGERSSNIKKHFTLIGFLPVRR